MMAVTARLILDYVVALHRQNDQRMRSLTRLTLTPRQYRQVAELALAFLTLIVFTGAAVRLSGSGLGCPDWPKCYGNCLLYTSPSPRDS